MKYNILVADDDRFVHMFIENAIESEHHEYKIISAFNGQEACDLVFTKEVDLIIMDWEMPVMNGIDALDYIKSDPNTADIPIIIITSSGNLQTAFEAGGGITSEWRTGVPDQTAFTYAIDNDFDAIIYSYTTM